MKKNALASKIDVLQDIYFIVSAWTRITHDETIQNSFNKTKENATEFENVTDDAHNEGKKVIYYSLERKSQTSPLTNVNQLIERL